jgi:hypothetical protein
MAKIMIVFSVLCADAGNYWYLSTILAENEREWKVIS